MRDGHVLQRHCFEQVYHKIELLEPDEEMEKIQKHLHRSAGQAIVEPSENSPTENGVSGDMANMSIRL